MPLFIEQIRAGNPITITDPNMTRFMMTLNDAVGLVLFAFENEKSGGIFVQKSRSTIISSLAIALAKVIGAPNHPIVIIGTRHGEKQFESLLSREERAGAVDIGEYFRIPPDLRDLNYEKSC